jgi:2-polyprenyl-6-methoxyphenol hydroxylase-like FAD-dependent oxidoreductase
VAADGLHSETRDRVLGKNEYHNRETGWGGWVGWADPSLAPIDTYVECWGAGRFVGLYPTADRLGVFFGGPVTDVREADPAAVLKDLSSDMGPNAGVVADVLKALALGDDPFYWDFHDCRSARWRSGSVVLLGDAAAGFLPTAGVGASMAMESAAALADELSRTGTDRIAQALELYERRHRARVERAQDSSRHMGRLMFVESRPLAWGRDQLVKLYSLEQLIQSVATMMDEPI